MRSVVLSGFMATGKTTLGPRLAARLALPYVDTDEAIAAEAGRSVPDLWRAEGEGAFRAREGKLVEKLLSPGEPARVIAFGGGTVTVRRTRHLALERAIVVTLRATPESVVARVPDIDQRPNLAVGGDPVARARELMEARDEAYAECHASLDTDALDPDAALDAIEAVVRRDPIVVPLGKRTYAIDVARDAPSLLTDAIARCAPSSIVLVTDANVQRARHAAIERALEPLATDGTRVTLPAGEQHKTLASVGTIWDAALGAGIDRDGLIVAVGGGVVGDLAGFAAATLLRGIRFVQAPTTLLAMVDASVGGKTGFDHPAGKNLLGAFHQPSAAVVDLAHLETLHKRDYAAGLAEIVKIALVTDAELLARIEATADALAARDAAALLPVVRRAIEAKVRIVRDDEREAGQRALLNLGHTIGHAVEAHGRFERYLHGEAVAIGTVLEMRATASMGLTPAPLVARTETILRRVGLPTTVESATLAAAWGFVAADKKRQGAALRLPVVLDAGVGRVDRVSIAAFERAALGLR